MAPPSRTRRSVLRTGGTIAAVLGTGGLAGCVDGLGSSGTAGSDRLAQVPNVADAVFTVDVNTFFADDGVRNTYNAWLEARAELPEYDGPSTLSETLDDFEQQEGVDLRDLSDLTAFFSVDGERSVTSDEETAYVFEGGWSEEEVLSLVNHEYVEYTESTYEDYTVYEPGEEYSASIGVLEDGRYVLGGHEAVQSTVDVERGAADPIDGPVADAYHDSQAGPVRFGTTVREEWIPEEVGGADESLDLSPVRAVETAGGAIYRDGNTRGLEVSLHTPDSATADELDDAVNGLLTLAEGEATNSYTPEFVSDLLGDMAVTQEGSSVAVSVERTVDELEAMASEFGDRTSGRVNDSESGSGVSRAPPQVSFEWEYDADARIATVTHTAGDVVAAENLGVAGEGFADVDGADVTEPTSGISVADGEITAGDRITIGADPDCRLMLVWESENSSGVMTQYEGPRA